jgi:hypothetical protein
MKALVVVGLVFGIIGGISEFRADYAYDNSIGSFWDLSEKASTLQQKSEYLDQYVQAIETARFAPNDAVIFPTPNNSYQQNMVALKSLQGRMHQIAGVDERSFAYQTAIQQITAQEQGEGDALTDTLKSCWFLENHSVLWGWHDFLFWLILVVGPLGLAGILALVDL